MKRTSNLKASLHRLNRELAKPHRTKAITYNQGGYEIKAHSPLGQTAGYWPSPQPNDLPEMDYYHQDHEFENN